MDDEEYQHLQALRRNYQQRLWKLEEQAALQGTATPPAIQIELDQLQNKMVDITARLGMNTTSLSSTLPSATMQEPTFTEAQVGRVWLSQSSEERQRVNVEVADQMKQAKQRIDIHDSLFSKEIGHPWEQEMIKALNRDRDIHITLILANPKSDIYKKRYTLVSNRVPSEEWPKQLGEWIERYPEQLSLRSTDELFSGPFVWIDRTVLFMGFFAPGIHSDQAPFIELRYTESLKSFFEGLEKWIEARPVVRL
jgi:hypothetical protein